MTNDVAALDVILACLATWRMTSLLVREEGPYALFARGRRALGDTVMGRAFSCFYCGSLWVAAPLAYWLVGVSPRWGVAWLALSAAALLADRAVTRPALQDVLELDDTMIRMSAQQEERR